MVPPTSLRLSFTFGQKKIEMTTVGPKDLKIHDFNIRSLFTHLGVERVLELFTCILFEQKVIKIFLLFHRLLIIKLIKIIKLDLYLFYL